MRLDRPIGSWLLYWPCAWSVALAGVGGRAGYGAFLAEDQWQSVVKDALRQSLVLLDSRPAPAGETTGEWYSLDQTFVMESGISRLPKPPIQ